MAKKASKKTAKRPAKKGKALTAGEALSRAFKNPKGEAYMPVQAGACRIMYRVGAILRIWNPGDPVTQIMRDVLEKHIPPITAGERMALEAKRRVHNELAGSVAIAKAPDAPEPEPAPVERKEERRRVTTAELLGAPAATEIEGTADRDPQPVKAGRVRPQLI